MALNYLAIGIFLIVYTVIALRNLRWFRIPVWTVMLAGAVAMIFLDAIPLQTAYQAVNLDVIFFLLGMFTVVAAMDLSGLLEYLTLRILVLAKSPKRAFALVIAGMSGMSAFLMNDTLALMATPIMLGLAKQMRIRPQVLLVTLAISVTIGSMFTPVGNPQNLLIALGSGIPNPFFDFLHYLLLPALACILVSYFLLRLLYRKDLAKANVEEFHAIPGEAIHDGRLARLSGYTATIVILGFFAVGVVRLLGLTTNVNLGTVALLGATIIFVASNRRREILGSVDWGIIIFFISLFIVMEGFWESNALQTLLTFLPGPVPTGSSGLSTGAIIVSSLFLSQVLSNVPFVAVYIRALQAAGFTGTDVKAWMALAGASTLAGGFSLLGAASNVIILEEAEHRGAGFSFLEFLKAGVLVTIPNLVILYLFLLVL